MRYIRYFAALVALVGLAPAKAGAQDSAATYPVKFVCGAQGSAQVWDAVYPGRYFTAINIRNPSLDTLRLGTSIAATLSTPSQGPLIGGPVVYLEPGRAIEIDCQESATRAHARS